MIRVDGDSYETEVKAGLIIVFSLGALHPGTRKCFEELLSVGGRTRDRKGMDLWMKRLVIESIKGSLDFWINVSPRVIGSFEPKETIDVMKRRNMKLSITEDKRQINNDMLERLLNGITNIDKELLNTEVNEVQVDAIVELMKEDQVTTKRNKTDKLIPANNVEPKKRD
jgi:hypothetical protein